MERGGGGDDRDGDGDGDGSKKIRRVGYLVILVLIAAICWMMFFADRDHYHGQVS